MNTITILGICDKTENEIKNSFDIIDSLFNNVFNIVTTIDIETIDRKYNRNRLSDLDFYSSDGDYSEDIHDPKNERKDMGIDILISSDASGYIDRKYFDLVTDEIYKIMSNYFILSKIR